ncbi:hypothetical protein D1AOALGA4SA_10909 [Olavius algarvensis Delta 1 endosymbiont]|nr:hypothetical protein D1AOALGA4SA_10909 [Olavius algarvensis Delta 1 endosymbiont]
MRILDLRYSVHFKLIERSDSTIRHYSLFISHSLKFHTSAASGQKNGQSDQLKKLRKSEYRISNKES